MRNFTKTDRLLFVFAALLLAAFSYFMYDDSLLFPKTETEGLQQIGQVSFSSNDVRLKTATAFTWFPAQKSDHVHLQDSIFTGERSEATVQLQDGTVLTLKPNSLITLNMNNGQMNLDLRYGDLSSKLSGKSSLTVTAGDKTFDLEGDGNIQIAKPSIGAVDVSVTEGSARLKGANGVEKLDKGKKLSLGKKPVQAKADIKIEQTTPENATFVRLEAQDPIGVEWKTTGEVASYEVDVCGDAECKDAKPFATREQKVILKDGLKNGPSFWRVRGLDKFGNELAKTGARAVNIVTAEAPVITTPGGPDAKVEGVVKINKADDKVAGQLQLTWTTHNYYGQYELEITSDQELKAPVHAAATEQGGLLTPGLPNGVYYYHVRGVLKNDRRSAWSEPSRFQVDMKGELPQRPSKPILAKKKFEFNPVEEQKRVPASVPKPVINWTKSKGAVSYQVQMSKTPDFEKPLNFNLTSEAMAWPDYQPGEWHVRVIAVNKEGLKSLPSDPSILKIEISDPVLSPLEKFSVRGSKEEPDPKPKQLRAQWTEIPFAQSYAFEIADNPKFENAKVLESKTTAVTIPVMPGQYYTRVRARDGEGKPITNYSPVAETEYTFRNAVKAPELMEPFDKASIFLQTTQEPFIWLEWKRAKDADFYQVQVASDPEFKNKIISEKLKDNRFLIQTKIPVGKLYWRVRAVIEKDKQISEWTDLRLFNIFSKKNEAFIK